MAYDNLGATVSDMETRRATSAAAAPPGHGLLAALWRRKAIFSVIFIAILGAVVAALLVLPVQYMATGSVIVAEQEPGDNNSSAVWAQKAGDPADMESQLLIIGSSRVLKAAIAAPGVFELALQDCAASKGIGALLETLGRRSGCDKLREDADALVEFVRPRYSIGNVGRSRVISISYQSTRPEIAQKMANALIAAFLEDQRANLSSGRQHAADWLWAEVHRLETELRDDDGKIQEYKRKKGLARGTNALIDSERLTSLTQQLSTAEATRAEASARLREISANKGKGLADSPAVLASRSVSDLKQQLTMIEIRLASTRTTLGDRHPALRELEQERDIAQRRLAAEVAGVAAAVKRNYEAANSLVASLKAKVEGAKIEVGDAMIDQGSIETLVHGVDMKRRQYSELYKRASELDADRRVLNGSTRLVGMAELPNQPYFPKKLPFLAAGLTLATLLGATAAILRDRFDKSLRGSAELTALAGDALCVELPHLRGAHGKLFGRRERRDRALPLMALAKLAESDETTQRQLFEIYSSARIGEAKGSRIIAVTSPAHGDGKTFLTLALAQFVATMGHRVLVVECDRANPCFDSALGLEHGPGLLEALDGTASLRDCVTGTASRLLDALPLGASGEAAPPQIGKRIETVLKATRDYDLVLLDCPPADALDARLLVRQADSILLCARAGGSSAEEALAASEALTASGGRLLGVVVNLAERDEPLFSRR
ncbi:LPS biosynthesis protein [Methylosinus sp. C49]|uniref:GumC family protein n=1 Tax=Methylosinus sp. C49 TaxID=2699395 RepID=UPI0013675F01|nr:polysaccharide biosynthesis tyrosine autokinase [Methylosinus sp. C49]BBU62164.1 LPS biosynthesis protein [Methylosinus sp. C49]